MNDFLVRRTTTDKLQDELNDLVSKQFPIIQTQYTGGRDWVIICGQSEMDPWHPKNFEAGKPGVFQPWMCGIWPSGHCSGETSAVPCLYQRGHSGRHHFESFEIYDLYSME